tara:strand:- start:13777 stop:14823 length:1047 start_codon:yes stop_codon:yes gene_type:complete
MDFGNEAPQTDRRDMLREQLEFADITPPPDKVQAEPANAEKTERARDDAGKFAPRDQAAAKEAKAPLAPAPASVAPEAPVEPPVWERPPASWKKEYHPLWTSADPKLREYAFQREEQMRAGVEPLLPKAQLADAITKAAEPYMNTINGLGTDIPTAVRGLMQSDHELRTLPPDQKYAKFMQLAQYYGVNLSGMDQQVQSYGAPDPLLYNVQNEVLSLKGQLSAFQQQQTAAEEQKILADVNKFAAKAEHFEELRPVMAQLLQSGVVDNLEDAYEKAMRLDDQLFTTTSQAKQAQVEADKRAAADAAAKNAKRAAVSVRSATPGSTTTTKAQDRRSMLLEQFDSVNERL